MKFYDIDSVFISGKYAGETLAEVYEKDPKYINYCQENDDDFYISPEVMKELRTLARDHRLLTQDLDKLTDEELSEFMEEMNEIDPFDEGNFDDDFDWDEAEENMFEEFEDEYDIVSFEDYRLVLFVGVHHPGWFGVHNVVIFDEFQHRFVELVEVLIFQCCIVN